MSFKITIPKDVLMAAVEFTAAAVDNKATLPILSHLNICFLEDGSLSIIGGGGQRELEYRIKGDSVVVKDGEKENIRFTVPAKKLKDLLKSAPANCDATLAAKNDSEMKYTLTFSGIKSKFTMNGLSPADYPAYEVEKDTIAKFELDKNELLRCLSGVSHAMANQDVRYYLNGLNIKFLNNSMVLESTDGHRLAVNSMLLPESALVSDFANVNAIVPRSAILAIPTMLKSADTSLNISITQNLFVIHATSKESIRVIKAKLIDGRFPDTDRVRPKSFIQSVTINRAELIESVRRVAILSNEKFRGIRLSFKGSELVLSCNNPESEEAVEIIEIAPCEDLDIAANVDYMLSALEAYDAAEITLNLNEANSSILINTAESPEQANIVMPMRL